MLSHFKAYLFDYDGVIANTMEYNYLSWVEALKEYQIELDKNTYFSQEGYSRITLAKEALISNGSSLEMAESIAKRKDEIFIKKYAAKVEIYPYVNQLLEYFKNNQKKLALVTGASRERITGSSINKEVLPYFDTVITADDTKRSKPFPDPFKKAQESLGVNQTDCLVIENAPLGIKAAKAADMKCIALMSTLKKEDLSEADHIFQTGEEILAAIRTE